MYFNMKSYLKRNHYHTTKHTPPAAFSLRKKMTAGFGIPILLWKDKK
jgi:hypothetical protein